MSVDAFIEMTNRAGSPAKFRCHFRGAVADIGHRNAIFAYIGGGVSADGKIAAKKAGRNQNTARGGLQTVRGTHSITRLVSNPYGGAAGNSGDC